MFSIKKSRCSQYYVDFMCRLFEMFGIIYHQKNVQAKFANFLLLFLFLVIGVRCARC